MAINTPLVTSQPEIGKLIRELRIEAGLTQAKFAAVLGVTYPTVSRWENGLAQPSPLAIKKIEQQLRQLGERRKDLLELYLTKPLRSPRLYDRCGSSALRNGSRWRRDRASLHHLAGKRSI